MAELLRTHSSQELTEWIAYERVTGPLGPERHDVLNAILAATVSNAARGKGQKPKGPADFIPKWDQDAGQDWQQMLATAKAMNRRMGGDDRTRQEAGHGAA
ncbi:hypothetical protein ACFVH0_35965 [Streptomyces sp. NPDC127117]|uniref:phage tail assembly protein T n=1 Tax=Streptomyces sp. NPDC127117 TaxID=3345368 RepID=UPI00362AF93A